MPGQQLFEKGGSSSYNLPCGFKKPKLNAFRSFPANCGAAPTPLAARSDSTNLKRNTVSESALGYSTTPFSSSSSNIKRSKVDLSGNILKHHGLFATGSNGSKDEWFGNRKIPRCPDGAQHVVALPAVPLRSLPAIDMKLNPRKSMSSHDEVQKLANTTDNTVHKKEELWKQESDKLAAVIADAKEFINLLDSRYSMPNVSVADDFLKDSREYKDQLPSLESDALHSRTSIGEHKPMMETVKQDVRERDQILAESVMLQNKSVSGKKMKDNSGISVFVQGEKDSGTETLSEDSDDEFCLLSPAEWNALQLHFNHKDEGTKPSVEKSVKMLERRSSLKFARECRDVIEPQGRIVDFIDPISVGTKSDQPCGRFPDCELTETEYREHQSHEIVALNSYKSLNATNSNNALDCCENYKELVNLEIVPHDQSERRMVMQALKLFKEEYSKLLPNHEKKAVMSLHIEAAGRVMAKRLGVSKDNNRFGHIPGIQIGDEFSFRSELVIVGLHFQFAAGIDSMKLDGKRYATSVVNSWCYVNKATSHDTLIYSGQGGNPKVSNRAAADQKLERGNLALCNSMEMGYPVRVIHRRKCLTTHEREYMYVYDGLYKVINYWQEREDQTQKLVYKFELQRLPEQPKICGTNVKLGKQTEKAVCVLNDISQGKEEFPVRVFNAVDNDDMPLPFTYITKNVYPHWYQPVDPIGCNCIDGCSDSEQCPCVIKNGGEIPFNEKGALLRAKRTVVHECGPSCKCPPSCMNRVSQHGPRNQFYIFKTKSMGWGVKCRDYITSGGFICEYVGELLGDKEAEKRIGNDEYLFDICPSHDEEGQFEGYHDGKLKHNGFTLDAAKYGNVGRFMNHSCSPNVFSQEVIYDNDDKRMPRIMFFAGKNIAPGHELRYDYNYKPNRVRDENGNIKKKACQCGSRKCTGRLY